MEPIKKIEREEVDRTGERESLLDQIVDEPIKEVKTNG